jgi:hypothetical protein
MGLRANYQKPRTTVPGDPAERFPCLVDLSEIKAADQAWATDITYIPLQKGFHYLVAVVDLFSSHVLSWKLSNSLDTELCRMPWRWSSVVAVSRRSSTPTKDVSSPPAPSWLGPGRENQD